MRSMHLVWLDGRKFVNIRNVRVPTFVDSAVFRTSLWMNHPGVAVGVVGGEAHYVNLALLGCSRCCSCCAAPK